MPTAPSPIDLAAFEQAPLERDPFDHVLAAGFVPPAALAAIVADFPETPGPGAYTLDQLSVGGAFAGLVEALLAPGFARAVERKFDVDLAGRPTFCTVRGWCGPRDGRIHTDTSDKIITVLLYLNQPWEAEGGRLRLLRGRRSLDDYAKEIPPDGGALLVFRRSKESWHGHAPFEGQRRALQLNWIKRGDIVAFKEMRLRAVAAASSLLGAPRGR